MRARKALVLAVKVAVTASLFAWLFTKVPVHEVAALLVGANPYELALAVLGATSTAVVAALRWKKVAEALRLPLPYLFFLRGFFVGLWFNQLLPSGIGGDAVKAWELARVTKNTPASVKSVLLDRASGLGALVLLVALSLPTLYHLFEGRHLFGLFLLLVGGAAIGLVFLVSAVRWRRFLYRRRHGFSLGRMLWKLSRDIHRAFFASPRRFFTQLGLSLYAQLMGVVVFYLLALSLGANADFVTFVALVPPVFLMMLVPVSLAGWGVREGAVVGLFTLSGVLPATTALAVSLLYGLVSIVSALPGGVFLFFSKERFCPNDKRPAEAERLHASR